MKNIQNNNGKNKKKVQTHGQGLGEAWQGTWVWTFCFLGFSMVFCSLAKNLENTKKKFRPMGKVWAIHTQTKKTKKTRLHTPRGGGQMQSVGSCLFVFLFFLFFCFFGLCVDSHCRCAKQRLPGTVSGCTRSKVDTLQYSNICYDIVHSANEQRRGMEFNFVRLRHMLLDLCTGNAAICALPWWPVLLLFGRGV